MSNRKLVVRAVPIVIAAPLYAFCKLADAQEPGCGSSARVLRYACSFDARDDLNTAQAQCHDQSVVDLQCLIDAQAQFDELIEECGELMEARLAVCAALYDAVYEPNFGVDFAADFVDPTTIGFGVAPNPFFPLVAGNRWVYEGDGETITVTVTDKTKRIDGIDCVVVNDIALDEDGAPVENTNDWYAQHTNGDVWYCGEIAENYESFDGDEPVIAELVDIDGSWKHGRDGAKAGLLLPAEPQVGSLIRQEVLYTDAEDVIEILSTSASEIAPGGTCDQTCLQTRDFTPLERGVDEHKFYAPGIGMIVEFNLEDDERLELAEFIGVGR